MTTKQTAIEAKKLVDELAEIQTSQHKYAQVDQANWMTDKLERLQQLMTYVVDDLINGPLPKPKLEVAIAS